MKVIAFQSKKRLLVSMKMEELSEICGFMSSDFDKAFGLSTYYGRYVRGIDDQTAIISVEDYPVSQVFQEARETLKAYEELRSKFESIRNQLTILMGKMVKAKPEKKEQSQ